MRVREPGVPLSHRLLQRDSASHRLHRTRKFHQNAVAFDPDNAPGMSHDVWPNNVPQHTLQTAPRADLVLTSKPAIADHVGKKDCCQAALHAFLRHRVSSGLICRRWCRPKMCIWEAPIIELAGIHSERTAFQPGRS